MLNCCRSTEGRSNAECRWITSIANSKLLICSPNHADGRAMSIYCDEATATTTASKSTSNGRPKYNKMNMVDATESTPLQQMGHVIRWEKNYNNRWKVHLFKVKLVADLVNHRCTKSSRQWPRQKMTYSRTLNRFSSQACRTLGMQTMLQSMFVCVAQCLKFRFWPICMRFNSHCCRR